MYGPDRTMVAMMMLGLFSIPFFLWEIGRLVWWLVSHLHWS